MNQTVLDAPMYGEFHGKRDRRDGLPPKTDGELVTLARSILQSEQRSQVVAAFIERFTYAYRAMY